MAKDSGASTLRERRRHDPASDALAEAEKAENINVNAEDNSKSGESEPPPAANAGKESKTPKMSKFAKMAVPLFCVGYGLYFISRGAKHLFGVELLPVDNLKPVVQGSIILLLASRWIFTELDKYRVGKQTISAASERRKKANPIRANAERSGKEVKGKAE